MKYVDSGCGKIPFISLVAILSISLTVNLPGLAISPILGKLDQVFSHVTELESQLLTVLPNLVTIPFILGSGKICTPKNQIFILGIGLAIYTLTGVLYFCADSMVELILLSCLLGVGCGLVIPLAASLISQYFVGKARTRQLGMKSGISNFTVIFATLFVGWIASISWHLSFIVYMVPIIPLCLIPFMTSSFIEKHKIEVTPPPMQPLKEPARPSDDDIATTKQTKRPANVNFHFQGRTSLILLFGTMALYFMATYGTEVVSYYPPFAMENYKLTTGDVGVATAMFFTSATISGFFTISLSITLSNESVSRDISAAEAPPAIDRAESTVANKIWMRFMISDFNGGYAVLFDQCQSSAVLGNSSGFLYGLPRLASYFFLGILPERLYLREQL